MRGRKPTPLKIAKLRGNPGKRPLPEEPAFDADLPTCPKHLDAEAKAEWARVVGKLPPGLISSADRSALAAYCQLHSRIVKLERIVQRAGEVLKDAQVKRQYAKGGKQIVTKRVKLYRSPYAIELHACYDRMKAFGSEFGLSPTSRRGLHTAKGDSEDEALAAFMAEGRKQA